MKREYFGNQRGFTPLELMVAVLLTSMFAASFYTAFRVMNAEMWRTRNYFETNVSAKNVLDRISKDTEEAVNVVTSWAGNATGTDSLVLKVPSIDGAGEPTNISTQFDYITYRINPTDSTQLLRSVDVLAGTSQREGGADITDAVVGRRIESVVFSYVGTSLGLVAAATIPQMKYINAQITTQRTTLGATQQTQVDTDITLKNRIS